MDAAPTGMAALLVLVTALAGCTGDPPVTPPGPEPGPTPPEPEPEPIAPTGVNDTVVLTFDGSAAGLATPDPVGMYLDPMGGDHVFEFEVPAGATAIVVEAAWDGSDALDLLVEAPTEYCQQGAAPGMGSCPPVPGDRDGSSPAVVLIVEPEFLNLTGTWTLGVWAKQSPQPVAFRAAVSVFQGALPEAGYTALAVPPA